MSEEEQVLPGVPYTCRQCRRQIILMCQSEKHDWKSPPWGPYPSYLKVTAYFIISSFCVWFHIWILPNGSTAVRLEVEDRTYTGRKWHFLRKSFFTSGNCNMEIEIAEGVFSDLLLLQSWIPLHLQWLLAFLWQVKTCAIVPRLHFRKSNHPPSSQDSLVSSFSHTIPFFCTYASSSSHNFPPYATTCSVKKGFLPFSPYYLHYLSTDPNYGVLDHYQGPTTISFPPSATAELCPIVISPSLTQVLWEQPSFSSPVLLPLTSVWARWSSGASATPSPCSCSPLARICDHTVLRLLFTERQSRSILVLRGRRVVSASCLICSQMQRC